MGEIKTQMGEIKTQMGEIKTQLEHSECLWYNNTYYINKGVKWK